MKCSLVGVACDLVPHEQPQRSRCLWAEQWSAPRGGLVMRLPGPCAGISCSLFLSLRVSSREGQEMGFTFVFKAPLYLCALGVQQCQGLDWPPCLSAGGRSVHGLGFRGCEDPPRGRLRAVVPAWGQPGMAVVGLCLARPCIHWAVGAIV